MLKAISKTLNLTPNFIVTKLIKEQFIGGDVLFKGAFRRGIHFLENSTVPGEININITVFW